MLQLVATLQAGTVSIQRADGATASSACESGRDALSASELLAASLASCIVASLAPILERHARDASALHVRVAPRAGALLDGLSVAITLPGLPADLAARCRRAAEACPVRRALNIPLDIDWYTD